MGRRQGLLLPEELVSLEVVKELLKKKKNEVNLEKEMLSL